MTPVTFRQLMAEPVDDKSAPVDELDELLPPDVGLSAVPVEEEPYPVDDVSSEPGAPVDEDDEEDDDGAT